LRLANVNVSTTFVGAGNAIVAWADDRTGISYDTDIYAQRIGAAGDWATDGVPVCSPPGLKEAIYFDVISDHTGLLGLALGSMGATPLAHTVHGPLTGVPGELYERIVSMVPHAALISVSDNQRRPTPPRTRRSPVAAPNVAAWPKAGPCR
jgi:hypothetical protein